MTSFPPELNQTLATFVRMMQDSLQERLVSILLHGSILFDDLAPGYSDLDFVVVVSDDLDEADCAWLDELRKPLRDGSHGIYGQMLEGAFLPRRMLNPCQRGKAFWWGTSGNRPWEVNGLGWFVLYLLREEGIVIHGEDVRAEISPVQPNDLLAEVKAISETALQHGIDGTLHCVDWLLLAARTLLWLQTGRLDSKSAAADWAYLHAQDDWKNSLPQVKHIRLDSTLADTEEIRHWLNNLTPTIQSAWQEVQKNLAEKDKSVC